MHPSLTDAYKDFLKRQYSGLWYQRYIEGQWVQAEGAVFDMFSNDLHVLDFAPTCNPDYYLAGIDYGTTNPCAFLLLAYSASNYPNMWVEKEYYWNSKERQKQKTDTEYAEDFIKFVDNLSAPLKTVYLDPSAVSFRLELQRHGVRGVQEADNDVLPGIRFVAGLLSNGTLKITAACKNLIHEFKSYLWDDKARERAIDKPLKQADHAIDSLRYVCHSHYGANVNSDSRMTKEDLKSLRNKWGYR